jgi:hypothetical protein
MGMHMVRAVNVAAGLKVGHFIGASVKVGLLANRLKSRAARPDRWTPGAPRPSDEDALVQIQP